MGKPGSLAVSPANADAVQAKKQKTPPVYCGLCGMTLKFGKLRYLMVSPQSPETTLMVCHTCHRAALGEGYRLAF